MNVCRFHGGGSPIVRAAADRRLAALAPLAVQALQEILEDPTSRARLRATKYVIKLLGIDSKTLWERAPEQLAIEAGGTPLSADEQIDALLASLSDTNPSLLGPNEPDISDTPGG
jgi:hypothetical protein